MDLFLRTIKNPNNPFHAGLPNMFWGQGENDLVVDSNGDFAIASGVTNLAQQMAKIIVTERGANSLFPSYGSQIQSFVGLNVNIDYLRAQIKTELIDTLRIYQFINKDNPILDEQIDTLKSLKIDLTSPDGITVSFVVVTPTGQTVGSTIKVGS